MDTPARLPVLARRPGLTASLLLAAVTAVTGCTRDVLRGRGRTQTVADARQVAAWLLHHVADLSYPDAGGSLGGRDHTTVMHACRVVRHEINIGGRRARLLVDVIGYLSERT